jgi:hypothetical protein
LTLETHSRWLVNEWDQMMQWQSVGYQGLDRNECPGTWSCIMRDVEEWHRRVQGSVGTGERIPQVKNAAQLHAREVTSLLEELLRRPVDSKEPSVPPWSQWEQRSEAA